MNGWLVVWTAVYAIATVVLAGGIGIAIWQIYETRKSTNAQIAMDLFKELRDKKTMAELRCVIYKLPDNYSKAENSYHEGIIEYLVSRFNLLGVLVEKRIIDKKLAVDAYAGTTSLRCWYQLYKYIWEARSERKYFAEDFEAFTNRCCQHFKDNKVEVGFKNIDLVRKLLDAKEEKDDSKKKLYPRSLKEIRKERKKARVSNP